MPPKRKITTVVSAPEVSSSQNPEQGIDGVFDFEHASTVPTTAKNSLVGPAKKKNVTPRKPRARKQAPPEQEPAVAENSSQPPEGGLSESPPAKKPRKPRAKKQEVQEVHRDPLAIENLLIHTNQEPELSSSIPEVGGATPEKKPRKPRTKKQNVNPDPLSIDSLLIHAPQEHETAQIIPQFIDVTDAVSQKKRSKSKVVNQSSPEVDSSIAHGSATNLNHQDIESQEITIISQEQPTKKQRKPRAKKQELPEHSTIDNADSNDKSTEVDDVINNAQQVFDAQMKPKSTTTTRAPRTKKQKVSEDIHPESEMSTSILDNKDDVSIQTTDKNVQKSSSTRRGRPRKEATSHVDANFNASPGLVGETNEQTQKVASSRRGRPRKGKNSEVVSSNNDSEVVSSTSIIKEDDTNKHNEEHLQRAPSSKRGRPRKEKHVETNSPDEHPVDSQITGERSAEEDSSKKRRGRPKKDDLQKSVTQNNDSTHDEPFSEEYIPPSTVKNQRRGRSNKNDKKLDGSPTQQSSESTGHTEISPVNVERVERPLSHHETEHSSYTELSRYPSDNRQDKIDSDVVRDDSYPLEKEVYYGNSLDVLASVSVGDTMVQVSNSQIAKNSVKEKGSGESRDIIVANAPYSATTQLQQLEREEEVTEETIGQNVMEEVSEDIAATSEDDESESPKKLTPAEKMKDRFKHLQKLRNRMDEAEQANRQELYDEHQRKKINPRERVRQERKREEAEKLLARQETEEKGEDYERKQFWTYSVESVERWEKKQEKKLKRSDIAFTDYNQVAHKKYKRMINDFTPDLTSYNVKKEAARASASLVTTADGELVPIDAESSFYRDANSLQYASVDDQPSRESIDRLVNDVEKQIERREKFSRQKTANEDDDITYINERNRKFNEKIGRFYDKYTQEIKENFERGTA